MIKAVFFDLDDTLYNSTELAKRARLCAVEAMICEGLTADLDEAYRELQRIVKKTGSNYSHHFNLLLEKFSGYVDYKILTAGVIAYHNTKFANIKPFPDTIPTLLKLKERGKTLGIITNGKAVKQWEKILRLSLEHFFEVVTISELVGFEKPNPRIFEHAIREVGVEAEKCCMVDDKPEDLRGAKKVGMRTCLMNKVKRRKGDFDFEVNSLSEILEVIF